MFLFFDTETTGTPKNYNAPVTDSQNWPRMVQLAWIIQDTTQEIIEERCYIIKPDGFDIPKQAVDIHGITTELAMEKGIPLIQVLKEFEEAINSCDILVGHNISFDEKIIGAEFIRVGGKDFLEGKIRFCTMKSSTNYCKIKGRYGYKWPKLQELHTFLFKESFDGAHDALADIRATSKCFFELIRLKVLVPSSPKMVKSYE
jgi:DNA polymerase-3 subunit epsilon